MNVIEHLLVCLGEEAAEITQDCAKSLRFGLDDVNVLNPMGPNNRQRLMVEITQLAAVVDMLMEEGALPRWEKEGEDIFEAKKAKVREFMEYARKKGTLQ